MGKFVFPPASEFIEPGLAGPAGPAGPTGPAGGSSGTFIHAPGAAPAVERDTQDRLRDSVHLLDYIPVAEHAAIAAHTSTYDAIDAIHAAIAEFEVIQGIASGMAGPRLLLPRGKIRIEAPIQLKSTCAIEGQGAANSGDRGFGSIIEVAADQHGIIMHRFDTYDEDHAVTTAWVSGSTYAAGSVRYSTTTYSGIYEVVTPGGGASTDRPVHTTGDVTYGDGYTWRFLATARGSDGSLLRNFALQSLGGSVGHGIWMRTRATAYDLYISGFPGNGYNIVASANGAAEFRGNANNWRVYNGRVTSCQHGMFVDGADGNAGTANGVDCSSNRGWGFWDDSFLGNAFFGCHTNGNGQSASRQYNRFTWICIDGDLGPTTAPGTDVSVWWLAGHIGGEGVYHELIDDWVSGTIYTGAATSPNADNLVEASNGGVYRLSVQGPGTSTNEPLHASGALAYADGYTWTLQNDAQIWESGDTTIVEGGCFKLFSNAAVLIGCYAEAGQPAQLDAGTLAIYPGFSTGNLTEQASGWLWNQEGINQWKVIGVDAGGTNAWFYQIGASDDTDHIWTFDHDLAGTLRETLDRTNGALALQANNSPALRTILKTLLGTTYTFGRSAPVPHALYVDNLFVGDTVTLGRQITNKSASPTTGNWAAGDIVFNNAPLLGEPWGWRCILAGTPGTWQPLRDHGSQQTIATGAAFTLTPGTSPHRTLYTTSIVTDRAATLSKTGALVGLSYKITRTATGAFNLNVLNGAAGPTIKALAVNTWGEFAYDGTDYYLSAYGAL